MGTCMHRSHIREPSRMKLNDLKLLRKIGRGSFGRVWLAEEKDTRKLFALKVMQKAQVIAKKSVKAVLTERSILEKLSQQPSDCIVPIEAAFQTTTSLFLLMAYIPGGDLRHYLHNQSLQFTELHIKHLIRQILQALKYLHARHILHKDLKPENILIDREGRPRLTDFGIAEYYREENGHSNAGTIGYMAPEVMLSQNHTYTADYYALGIITHELFFGRRPYEATTKQDLLLEIATKELKLEHESASAEAMDFIAKTLERKQRLRLGFKGIHELEDHPWLVASLTQEAPSLPFLSEATRINPQQQEDQASKASSSADCSMIQNLLQRSHIQKLFQNYDYSPKQTSLTNISPSPTDSLTTLQSFIAL